MRLPRKFLLVAAGVAFTAGAYKFVDVVFMPAPDPVVPVVEAVRPPLTVANVEIGEGATFSALMERAGVHPITASAVFEAARETYDLSKVRVGRTIELASDPAGTLRRLTYQIDSEEVLNVELLPDGEWRAERTEIPYEVAVKTVEGEISSSLYEAALAQGIDERAIIALADVFQWDIDFAQDIRVGDRFRFVYEERSLDGAYVMPGRILAGKFVNDGVAKYAFGFETAAGEWEYFNEAGKSLRRPFLKSPVHYKYISSGFTTGRRYVSAFNVSTGHRAIDYAAPSGTPIRSVGDGVVTVAGWNGSYGNFVSVRHNETYTTNYAHQSRIAVKKGQRVSQGQVIGYVGSTGFSTGPHLHYEMVKRGAKINPLTEVFPPGDPVKDEDRARFDETVSRYKGQLE